MIFLEYFILIVVLSILYFNWEIWKAIRIHFSSQITFEQNMASRLHKLATCHEIEMQLNSVREIVSCRTNETNKILVHAMGDLNLHQMKLVTKEDFQNYLLMLEREEKILKEENKKIREDRIKAMKVAFGGKEED
jgi:hypothetical protein